LSQLLNESGEFASSYNEPVRAVELSDDNVLRWDAGRALQAHEIECEESISLLALPGCPEGMIEMEPGDVEDELAAMWGQ
jgi:hypothetical protein